MITFTLNNLNVYGVYTKLLQLCLILCNPTECTSLVAQTVKNPPAMLKTWVQSLGWEDPLEKGMATHSNIFPGEIHGQSSMSGYSSWGRKESEMTEQLLLSLWTAACRLGSSVHGILQARILEWATVPSSSGSS